MLVEFSVANYLSFKDRQTISLVASSDSELQENTFPASGPSDMRLLKSVGLYGANASGKSNLIRAMAFMRDFVRDSARGQLGDEIPVRPFKLSAETVTQPSEFEMVFIVDQTRYVYGFSADRERVHEEWLTARSARRGRPRSLFQRSGDDVEFGDSWEGDREELAQRTRSNALLLSVAMQFNNPTANPVFEWVVYGLAYMSDQPEQSGEMGLTLTLLQHPEHFIGPLQRFLRVADLGIEEVAVETTTILDSGLFQNMPDCAQAECRSEFQRAATGVRAADVCVPDPRFLHGRGEQRVAFAMNDESAGTVRLLAMFGLWHYLTTHGAALLLDELESKLHPLMVRFLVEQIHKADTNPQLVFTTHDCGLLDSKLFRRDQIWFVEKDSAGASHLYSLWDYTPRKGEDIRGRYLKGRYGAIPFLGEFSFAQGHQQQETT